MSIYISGKISGLPIDEARLNFSIYEKNLIRLGYKVVNPMSKKYWWNRIGKLPWSVYMFFDIILLSRCNGILFQTNWAQSKGAKIEFKAAKLFKIRNMNKVLIDGRFTPLPKEDIRFILRTIFGETDMDLYKKQLLQSKEQLIDKEQ